MSSLFVIAFCTLTDVESIICSDSSLESLDSGSTTRDVYGSWTVAETLPESEELGLSTKSLFRKHYWLTHGWTPNSDNLRNRSVQRQVGRFSYLRKYLKNPHGQLVVSRTARPVTGRWPSFRNSSRHRVPPGFGRPKTNGTTFSWIGDWTQAQRRQRTRWNGTSRTYFVKTFTTFTGSRRNRRINDKFRSRLSPYFRWHTASDGNIFPNNSPKKIIRGSRGPYGTRKPPRPNRFKWVSRLHGTKLYVGNLTCRLFIMRSRTTILLISPRRNNTTEALPMSSPSPDDGNDSTFTGFNFSMSFPNSRLLESSTSTSNYTNDDATYHTLGRQIESTIITNSSTKVTVSSVTGISPQPTTSKYFIKNEFPDISFKLKYPPEPNKSDDNE